MQQLCQNYLSHQLAHASFALMSLHDRNHSIPHQLKPATYEVHGQKMYLLQAFKKLINVDLQLPAIASSQVFEEPDQSVIPLIRSSHLFSSNSLCRPHTDGSVASPSQAFHPKTSCACQYDPTFTRGEVAPLPKLSREIYPHTLSADSPSTANTHTAHGP